MKNFFSPEATNIIKLLLDKDPDQRLGSRSDADEIMQHPFFSEIDWAKLEKKEIPALFKPDLSQDKMKYFNPNIDKVERSPVVDDEDDFVPYKSLEGFTYTSDSFKDRRNNAFPHADEFN